MSKNDYMNTANYREYYVKFRIVDEETLDKVYKKQPSTISYIKGTLKIKACDIMQATERAFNYFTTRFGLDEDKVRFTISAVQDSPLGTNYEDSTL